MKLLLKDSPTMFDQDSFIFESEEAETMMVLMSLKATKMKNSMQRKKESCLAKIWTGQSQSGAQVRRKALETILATLGLLYRERSQKRFEEEPSKSKRNRF